MKNKQQGGTREGAGRPKRNGTPKQVVMPDDLWEKASRIGTNSKSGKPNAAEGIRRALAAFVEAIG